MFFNQEQRVIFLFVFYFINIKGDLLYKNHFYKVFQHSCVAAVSENNQPIVLKIHQLIFYKTNKSQTVFPNELFQILPLFTSPRGKNPAHMWQSLPY